jgi:hypothetical protein
VSGRWKTCPVCERRHVERYTGCGRPECTSELRRRAQAAGVHRSPEGDTYVELFGERYYRIADLARRWSENVTTVHNWYARRERTGFPEPDLGYVSGVHANRQGGLWLAETADGWKAGYVPSRGGAPRGERNGGWKGGARRRIDEDGTRRRAS